MLDDRDMEAEGAIRAFKASPGWRYLQKQAAKQCEDCLALLVGKSLDSQSAVISATMLQERIMTYRGLFGMDNKTSMLEEALKQLARDSK